MPSILTEFAVLWTGLFHTEQTAGYLFVYSLIYSSDTEHYRYMLGMVVDVGDSTMNKLDLVSAQELFLLRGRDDIK